MQANDGRTQLTTGTDGLEDVQSDVLGHTADSIEEELPQRVLRGEDEPGEGVLRSR